VKQYEAVIQTLERLGGQATLATLYNNVLKNRNCEWGTKTPFASIRRIVQTRPEIFKVRPGLWALRSCKEKLKLKESTTETLAESESSHSYYQGLLVILGNLRGYSTFVPNQDRNKHFLQQTLGEIRTLQEIPSFSHDCLVKKSSTVDVIWFNNRKMPNSFFEVEHSTDIQNSLVKFFELQDFFARMVIVASENRQKEYEQKSHQRIFNDIINRVYFLGYDSLVRQYEHESIRACQAFIV
jgi:hypothetical protein